MLLQGISLAPGFAEGTPFHWVRGFFQPVGHCQISEDAVDAETGRLEQALQGAIDELEKLRLELNSEVGAEVANIFLVHQALLADPSFVAACRKFIAEDRCNAEQSVGRGIQQLSARLQLLPNPYFRERAEDIRDVGDRIFRRLAENAGEQPRNLSQLPEHCIIVARELFPSDTVELDRAHVAGIVTELGGPSSHTAILARSLGIPAVTRIPNLLKRVRQDDWLLVDGGHGTVTVSKGKPEAPEFRAAMRDYEKECEFAALEETRPCVTRCGTEIQLHANIGLPAEACEIVRHNLAGAGLVRTEFLFLNHATPPSLEEHLAAYTSIAGMAGNKPIVLRTLDLGRDKHAPFLQRHAEADLVTGLRGLRFALAERTLLETQLRAMLRARLSADVRILFPMVLGSADLREALDRVRALAAEEGVPVPPLGAMIETPAAVFEMDEILRLADFISVGTNDLTQFILAADRDSSCMFEYFSVLHPAVLKAVRQVIGMAKRAGKPVSVCGEAAGDAAPACLFVGMGCSALSMSPVRAARVRHVLSNCDLLALQAACGEALKAPDPSSVEKIMQSVLVHLQ